MNHDCVDYGCTQSTCPITAFYAGTEGVMPLRTGESVKSPPKPVEPLPVIDDDAAPLTGMDSFIALASIAAGSVFAAALIALYAPF